MVNSRRLPVILLLVAAFAPSELESQMVGEVGLPIGTVPEIAVVEDLEGAEVSLAEYVGRRPVLFEFWATWCENCEALLPQMLRLHDEYGDRIDVVALAVGVGQRPRQIKRHLERHPAPYPFLWDRRGRAVRAFAAPTTSFVVVLDANGVVTYTGVGPDQDIEAAALTALE